MFINGSNRVLLHYQLVVLKKQQHTTPPPKKREKKTPQKETQNPQLPSLSFVAVIVF